MKLDTVRVAYALVADYPTDERIAEIRTKSTKKLRKHFKSIQRAIEAKMENYNTLTDYYASATLQLAVLNGNTDLVNSLLANRDTKPGENFNLAILIAAMRGSMEIMIALEKDNRVSIHDNDCHALIGAIYCGQLETFQYLINHPQIDPNLHLKTKAYSPQHYAHEAQQYAILIQLLAHPRVINDKGILSDTVCNIDLLYFILGDKEYVKKNMSKYGAEFEAYMEKPGIYSTYQSLASALVAAAGIYNNLASTQVLCLYLDRLYPKQAIEAKSDAIFHAANNKALEVLDFLLRDKTVNPAINENMAIQRSFYNKDFQCFTRLFADSRVRAQKITLSVRESIDPFAIIKDVYFDMFAKFQFLRNAMVHEKGHPDEVMQLIAYYLISLKALPLLPLPALRSAQFFQSNSSRNVKDDEPAKDICSIM